MNKYKRYFLYEKISGISKGMKAVFGELKNPEVDYNMEFVIQISSPDNGKIDRFVDHQKRITEKSEFMDNDTKITPITKEENPEYFL